VLRNAVGRDTESRDAVCTIEWIDECRWSVNAKKRCKWTYTVDRYAAQYVDAMRCDAHPFFQHVPLNFFMSTRGWQRMMEAQECVVCLG
jgi:hypothetical protein